MPIINFNLPKPRRFNYRPRYYNERRERLAMMEARARAQLEDGKKGDYIGGLQKGFLSENRANSKLYRKKLERQSSLRFLIILLVILGLFYLWQPDIAKAIFKFK